MNYLHNPTIYWLFSLIVRGALFPIVLPVRLFEEYKEVVCTPSK